MYLFFDTETNGLPISWNAPMTQLSNWPRIIQFGWQVYDENETLVMEANNLIVPDGWEIPSVKNLMDKGITEAQAIKDSRFWVEHGYTTEHNILQGIPMPKALTLFIEHYRKCRYMIAHNMAFDFKIVGAEMLRYQQNTGGYRLPKICTMEASTNFCRLPGKGRGYKWPKLEEVHRILFQQEFDGAHDALADVKACARVFFELKRRKIIVLQ